MVLFCLLMVIFFEYGQLRGCSASDCT